MLLLSKWGPAIQVKEFGLYSKDSGEQLEVFKPKNDIVKGTVQGILW